MLQFSNSTIGTAVANHSGAMEADTIFKNRASLKSHTSRTNFLAMKRISLLFVLCASLMFIASCDKGKDEDKSGKFNRMNIEEAKTLFITSSDTGSKIYGVKKSSSKSTADIDGEIYEISYLDENGNQIEKNFNPTDILDAGDFVIVKFDGHESYFINKTNGLIYAIPEDYFPTAAIHRPDAFFFSTTGKIQLDKNKNIYYINEGASASLMWGLYKVSSIASSAIQFNQVSAVNDKIYGFCVDDLGQILYSHNNGQLFRIRKSDGSFANIDRNTLDEYMLCVWKGTDGLMYGIMRYTVDYDPNNFYLMKIQEGQIIKIRDVYQEFEYFPQYISTVDNIVFYVQGKIFLNIPQGTGFINISSGSLYKEIPCSVKPNMVLNDQLCYFDDKTFSCTLINIDTGETSLLFDLDESRLSNYDIDKIMSVTNSGVTFSAVQLSDGKYIVARIGLDNSVTIQQTIEGKVSVVLPLNL